MSNPIRGEEHQPRRKSQEIRVGITTVDGIPVVTSGPEPAPGYTIAVMTKATVLGTLPLAGPTLASALESLTDETDIAIASVVSRSDLSVDQKMRQIVQLDRRKAAWTSPRWAKLLGVTDAAIRGCDYWKELQTYRANMD